MNLQSAMAFVSNRADAAEQARLRYLLAQERPSRDAVSALLAGQRDDGGWPPFWASNYSSLDATCFRLAQAEQMGISPSEAAIARAVRFLAGRQHADGYWEEDASVASVAPPWAKPGEVSARLYLTANCGFWMAMLDGPGESALRAADFLQTHLSEDGRLPAFLHAHWLAGGLWYRVSRYEPAERVFRHLDSRLSDLAIGNLAWLITTLCVAGVPAGHRLVGTAAELLVQNQGLDGRWPSEDGPDQDVHSTLESMHALRLCGRF